MLRPSWVPFPGSSPLAKFLGSLPHSSQHLIHSALWGSPLHSFSTLCWPRAWSPAGSNVLLQAGLHGASVWTRRKLPFLWEAAGLYPAHRGASGPGVEFDRHYPCPAPGAASLCRACPAPLHPCRRWSWLPALRGSLTPLQMATASLDMDFG